MMLRFPSCVQRAACVSDVSRHPVGWSFHSCSKTAAAISACCGPHSLPRPRRITELRLPIHPANTHAFAAEAITQGMCCMCRPRAGIGAHWRRAHTCDDPRQRATRARAQAQSCGHSLLTTAAGGVATRRSTQCGTQSVMVLSPGSGPRTSACA